MVVFEQCASVSGTEAGRRPPRLRRANAHVSHPHSTSRLTWLRTASGRAVLARVDEPVTGTATGALVVVPSIGRENTVPFRRLRVLAVRAADAGLVSVSLFLSGDGESQDVPAGADLVSTWAEDVEAGLAAATAAVPGRPVNVVGWRLGAAVAHRHLQRAGGPSVRSGADTVTDPAAPGPVDEHLTPVTGRTVLWEPVSGASFLRQHTSLRRFASPVEQAAEGVELCGVHLDDAQAASLRTLTVPRRASENAAFETVHEPDPKQTLQLTLGSPHFVNSSAKAADAIVARLATGPAENLFPVPETDTATWGNREGVRITEELVCVGPDRLPGVVTRAPDVPTRAAVLYTAIGSELRAGPGNAWTDAARTLASTGVVGLRMDRRYLGEDTDATQPAEPYPYTEQSVRDVLAGAFHLDLLTGAPVYGAGACSGAWSLLRAAEKDRFEGVLAVNPVHWDPDPDNYDEAFYQRTYRAEGSFSQILTTAGGEQNESGDRNGRSEGPEQDGHNGASGGSRSADSGAPGVVRELVRDRARDLTGRARLRFHGLLHALAIRFPRLRGVLRGDRPTDRVGALLGPVSRNTSVVLAMGPSEEAVFRAKGGPAFLRSARNAGRVRLYVTPRIDHSLFARRSRDASVARLRELIDE